MIADLSGATWRKSTRSGSSGDCVEVAVSSASWRKSTRSGSSSDCVEVGQAQRIIGVRDSKNPTAGTLTVTAPTWSTFLTWLTA